jgi:3-keto-disaccharide hydrolase
MKTLPLTFVSGFVLLSLFSAAPRTHGAADQESGWTNLLSGDLSKHWTTTGNWTLGQNGVVTLTPRPGEKGWTRWSAYLWSKKSYSDFTIEFEYLLQKGGNSGFYFRVADVNDPVEKGIEVQISDSAERPADKPFTDHDSGGLIPGVPPKKNAAKPAGEWNKFQITNQAGKLIVKLNGETVNEVDLTQGKLATRPKTGNIGFQDHGLPLSLRNIRVRELTEQ